MFYLDFSFAGMFAFYFVMLLVILGLTQMESTNGPIPIRDYLLTLEWIMFTCISLYLAIKLPKLNKTSSVTTIMCLGVAVGNIWFVIHYLS